MTQEEKDLLIKDLCGRLPYGVVVGTTDNDGSLPNFWTLDSYNRLTEDVFITNCEYNADRLTDFCDVRPYLFPLSSMTEEQEIEFFNTCVSQNPLYWTLDTFKWLNKNHFDYNYLIDNDLAIDAIGLDIY